VIDIQVYKNKEECSELVDLNKVIGLCEEKAVDAFMNLDPQEEI